MSGVVFECSRRRYFTQRRKESKESKDRKENPSRLCVKTWHLCVKSLSLGRRHDHVPPDPLSQSLEHRFRHQRGQKSQLSARQLFHLDSDVLEHPKQRTCLFATVNLHQWSRVVVAKLNHT